MRTAIYTSLLFVILLAAVAAPASVSTTTAQQTGGPTATPRATPSPGATPADGDAAQGDDTERVTIRLVRLPITVVDKKGQPVAGLSPADFQILEDRRPQQFEMISKVEELERLPVYVAVLMDTSSSTAGKLKFMKEAASNFVHTVSRIRKDRVAFVTFDDEVELRQDFTHDLSQVDESIKKIKAPGHHTSLFDAIWMICNEKMRSLGPARRAMVVITDGDDTYSRATLKDAIDIAQRTETVIFAISTKGGFAGSSVPGVEAGTVHDSGDKDLEKLCEETGGRAFFTGDMLALERSFTRIAKELRAQYIATYRPTNDKYDGSFRRIEVKLNGERDGLKVRAKRGYLAKNDTVR